MLEVKSISKSFVGVRVLDDFSITVADGEVHALLGHNGSGKSTLIKILSGYYHPDPGSGSITLGGREMRLGDGTSSLEIGIRVVHQGLGLIPELSVLDNLRLGPGAYSTAFGKRIRWREERASARKDLARVSLDHIAPDDLVRSLSTVEQTGVAIVRALHDSDQGMRCLILDEPTGALPEIEVNRLVGLIAGLRAGGMTVLYVTHRLDEVPRVAQSVTVLRDGVIVGTGPIEKYDQGHLIRLIAGERDEVVPAPIPTAVVTGPPLEAESGDQGRSGRAATRLELVNVTVGGLRDLSLSASAGEVVGVISLVGAGATDVPRLLRGDERGRGTLLLDGEPISIRSPHDGQRQGIHVVPGRVSEKVFESLSVRENLTLGLLRRFWSGFHVQGRKERAFAVSVVSDLRIRCPGIEADIRLLSGGNKQKVVMGRALQLRPRILVIDQPTTGVDVEGRKDIFRLLAAAAAAGMVVVICSSDIDDMVGVCSRVIVLGNGEARLELHGAEISRERILTEVHAYAA